MTLKDLESRINEIRNRPLMLLCQTPDGHEREMNVRECIETGSAFIHMVRENDELDALLASALEGVKTP